jgi:hypothetical protein
VAVVVDGEEERDGFRGMTVGLAVVVVEVMVLVAVGIVEQTKQKLEVDSHVLYS